MFSLKIFNLILLIKLISCLSQETIDDSYLDDYDDHFLNNIDIFKKELLKAMGLKSVPKITNKNENSCFEFLKNIFSSNKIEYNEINCFDQENVNGQNFINNETTYLFKLKIPTSYNKVEIRIFRNSVYNQLINENIDLEFSINNKFLTKNINNLYGWINMDVTNLIDNNLTKKELVLNLKSFSNNKQIKLSSIGMIFNEPLIYPNIVFYIGLMDKKVTNYRSRREFYDEDEILDSNLNEKLNSFDNPYKIQKYFCRENSVYYDFQKIGWADWIYSPDGVATNFCDGRCAFPLKSNFLPTNHAILQSLMNLMHPDKYPEPCCSPKKTKYLDVFYYDANKNIVIKRLENLIITNCACI